MRPGKSQIEPSVVSGPLIRCPDISGELEGITPISLDTWHHQSSSKLLGAVVITQACTD